MGTHDDDDTFTLRVATESAKEITRLRTRIEQLTAALQALADAADARLHDPNWIPLMNARRVLAAAGTRRPE